MAKKSAAKAKQAEAAAPVASSSDGAQALATESNNDAREPVVRVNTANLSELKNAVDDHLKLALSSPEHGFARSYVHDDVRLAIGWSAVGVAAATGYYSYVVDDFHRTKQWVAVGVAIYVALNTALALYVALVEKDIIYEGKRRTFASRISTERISLSSVAYSSPNHHTTSSWVPFPLSLLLRSSAAPTAAPAAPAASSSAAASTAAASATAAAPPPFPTDPSHYPLYRLTLTYSHSSNANKSLLASSRLVLEKPFGEMFDAEGRLAARGVVEEWVLGREGLGRVLVGGQGERSTRAAGGLGSGAASPVGDEASR